ELRRRSLIEKSADPEALAVPQFHDGLSVACRDRRQDEAADGDRVRIIERAHLGEDLQSDRVVALDRAGEFQLDAEGLELDRDRSRTCHTGYDRIGQLSTSQESRRLAVRSQESRLCE